jgi:hypothetical protein
VRSRGEEEFVLEVRREHPDSVRAVGVRRVVATTRGGPVVGLIHDEQIEPPGEDGVARPWHDLAEQSPSRSSWDCQRRML